MDNLLEMRFETAFRIKLLEQRDQIVTEYTQHEIMDFISEGVRDHPLPIWHLHNARHQKSMAWLPYNTIVGLSPFSWIAIMSIAQRSTLVERKKRMDKGFVHKHI